MKHEVFVIFGEESTIKDKIRSGQEVISHYEFDTEAERTAFILGVNETAGWMAADFFDSKQEAQYEINLLYGN